jgi:centromere protein J
MSISFPDGSTKTISTSGEEMIKFCDGTVLKIQPNGAKLVSLPHGQIEEHTSQYRKRMYPDGTVKVLHMDGRVETRYKGGRVKVKDANGVVIEDNLMHADENVKTEIHNC